MRDQFAELLSEFGKEIGIPDLTFDENGTCSLIFDDVVVNIEKNTDDEKIFLYSNLGTIPPQQREAFYKKLLEANAFFKGTGGGTLAVDEHSNIVLFLYQVPVKSLDHGAFSKTMENYINIVEYWTEQVVKYPNAPSTASTSAPTGAQHRHVGMRV